MYETFINMIFKLKLFICHIMEGIRDPNTMIHHHVNIELFYCLIGKLLSIVKITRPNVQECVVSLLTTIDLPMNSYKNGNLNTDILFMKKIQIFVLSSPEYRYATPISRHYIMNTRIIF